MISPWARFLPNGATDPNFGSRGDGLVVTDMSTRVDVANAIVVQADGRIVAAGVLDNHGTSEMAAERLNADGSPDMKSSAPPGRPILSVLHGLAYAVALGGDGSIVLAGAATPPSPSCG